MRRITALPLSLLCAGLLTGPVAQAETAAGTAGKPVRVAKVAPTKKPATPSATVAAGAAVLAGDASEPVSSGQLAVAERVLTGTSQCEFNQTVSVDRLQDRPGHFRVAFEKKAYVMTPQETTTGAVRLEDRRNGIVWLQIPSKSMMMNQKLGQRMVDGCMHAEQQRFASRGAQ